MMVGMQDQMAKAWSNSNRRTDATREARAAVQKISSDLSGLLTRQTTNMDGYVGSIAVTNMGLPFVYSSNGVNSSGLTLPSGIQPGASFLFGVCTKKPRVPTDLDLMIFGYYIGQTNTTNINGFTTTNYNLYRYVVPTTNTVAALPGALEDQTKGLANTQSNSTKHIHTNPGTKPHGERTGQVRSRGRARLNPVPSQLSPITLQSARGSLMLLSFHQRHFLADDDRSVQQLQPP
jgi:hypothetical protein